MKIDWSTIATILTIIGTAALMFKSLKGDIVKLKEELKSDNNKLKEELKGDIKEVRGEVKSLADRLSSFEKQTEHRLTKIEMEIKASNQRLSTMESYLVPKKVFHFEEPPKATDEPKEN